MSVLLIDAGNSRIKWRWQNGNETAHGSALREQLDPRDLPAATSVLVASVSLNPQLHESLQALYGNRLQWWATPVDGTGPIHHCYPAPERLGVDRWLGMMGAREHQKEGALIVIDAGTALTVDLLSADNRHLGGYIVPGMQLSEQSLWRNTARVIDYQDEAGSVSLNPGQDTVSCVAAGVRVQQLALVEHVARQYPEYSLYITGGDGEALSRESGHPWLPDLILDGLETLCAGFF